MLNFNVLSLTKNESFKKYIDVYIKYLKAPDFAKSLIMRKEISLINKIFEESSILNKFKIILLERLLIINFESITIIKIFSALALVFGIVFSIIIPSSILMKIGIIVASIISMLSLIISISLLYFIVSSLFFIIKCTCHYYMKHELLRM
jgi:sterol desaturase/sphingolipid hydroxylase (fatty acid hydroxylase superfamily)